MCIRDSRYHEQLDKGRYRELKEETQLDRKYVCEHPSWSCTHHGVHYKAGIYVEPKYRGNKQHGEETWRIYDDKDISMAGWYWRSSIAEHGWFNEDRSVILDKAIEAMTGDPLTVQLMLRGHDHILSKLKIAQPLSENASRPSSHLSLIHI